MVAAGPAPHEHAQLVDGKASGMEEYPPRLVAAVLRGIRRQLQRDGKLCLSALEPGVTGHEDEQIDEEAIELFYDDITGRLLPQKLVRKARGKEIEFVHTFKVYEKVPAHNAKGKKIISVRWCDIKETRRTGKFVADWSAESSNGKIPSCREPLRRRRHWSH